MSNYIVSDADLTSVADAIRAKSGGSSSLAFPADFVSEIGNISGGGGITDPSDDTFLAAFINGTQFSGGLYLPLVTKLNTREQLLNGVKADFVHFPNAIGTTVNNFSYGSTIPIIVVEKAIFGGNGNRGTANLEILDYGGTGNFTGYQFYGCTKLTTLILRKDGVCSMNNTSNAISDTKFVQGGDGVDVYVPESQIASYEAATNWSTLVGWGTVRFQKIEGTYYETHWASGYPVSS